MNSDFGKLLYEEYMKLDNRGSWDSYDKKDVWNNSRKIALDILALYNREMTQKYGFSNSKFFEILKMNAINNRLIFPINDTHENLSSLVKEKFDIFVKAGLIEINKK